MCSLEHSLTRCVLGSGYMILMNMCFFHLQISFLYYLISCSQVICKIKGSNACHMLHVELGTHSLIKSLLFLLSFHLKKWKEIHSGSGKWGAVKYFPSTGKSHKEQKRIWNTALVTSGW